MSSTDFVQTNASGPRASILAEGRSADQQTGAIKVCDPGSMTVHDHPGPTSVLRVEISIAGFICRKTSTELLGRGLTGKRSSSLSSTRAPTSLARLPASELSRSLRMRLSGWDFTGERSLSRTVTSGP